MSDPTQPFHWTPEEYASFGLIAQVNKHRYHELALFTDDALIELLDNYPRRRLQAFTMGVDPGNNSDWKCVDIDDATTGEDLWRAVNNGRLWFNITHIEKYSKEYETLIHGMYEHIGANCTHLQNPKANYSTLLISSPKAQVYYHLDAEPNMLWHLRGQKTIWVYPAMNTKFVPQEYIEDIYAGEIDENLPFDPAFDADAKEYQLQPGDVASWPHNGPHRIVNDNLNVSLATSYYTPIVYKRQYVQLANRFLLRGMGIKQRGMSEDGLLPAIKRLSYRTINKIRPFKRVNRSGGYITDLQVDPDGTLGMRQLPEKRLASFSSERELANS